jgi:hypothetical protein
MVLWRLRIIAELAVGESVKVLAVLLWQALLRQPHQAELRAPALLCFGCLEGQQVIVVVGRPLR